MDCEAPVSGSVRLPADAVRHEDFAEVSLCHSFYISSESTLSQVSAGGGTGLLSDWLPEAGHMMSAVQSSCHRSVSSDRVHCVTTSCLGSCFLLRVRPLCSVCLSPVCVSGLVSSSKSSLSYLVSRPEGGNVAVIAVGGAPEALDARPGALTLQVQQFVGDTD